MNYIFAPFFGLLTALLSLTATVLMLFALPFIKWDKTESVGSYGIGNIKRGDLPDWWNRDDEWRYSFKVGVIKVLLGHKIYKLLDARFWAVSSFSLMVRR